MNIKTHSDLQLNLPQPRILLLVCCAPCACATVEALAHAQMDLTLLFFNPNIFERGEYEIRRDEVQRLAEIYHFPFVEGPYDPEVWNVETRGMESLPERSERCRRCFLLRLRFAARYAHEHHFNVLSSVLGFSRWKSSSMASETLKIAVEPYAETLTAWDVNWRKNGRQERNAQLMREHQLYNQLYCGCKFSLKK